jgi:glycosyltransferase involved in cell wall biosynthesis
MFVSCRPPFPLDNGARIRTYHLLSGLAASFDTVLVTFERDPWDDRGAVPIEELRALLPNVEILTAPPPTRNKRVSQLASLLGRSSWTLAYYQTSALASAVRRAARTHHPELIHFDDPHVALLAPIANAVNVYSAHNIEGTILRLQSRVGSPARRIFHTIEARKVDREEAWMWRTVDLCLAVSLLDAAAMKAHGGRVEICPNGVDPVERLPLRTPGRDEPLRLLFVGSGNYLPYERGLAWMVREVLPRLRSRAAVTFTVVGEPPNNPVVASDVYYVGRVVSVVRHYADADVVVVPVFEGSGTRLKIIEAAAYGRPVVSTRLGAEGLPLAAGEHYLQADDAADFANAVLQCAAGYRDPESSGLLRMLDAAQQAIEPLMWPRIVENLVGLYRAELERSEQQGLDDGRARRARHVDSSLGAQ